MTVGKFFFKDKYSVGKRNLFYNFGGKKRIGRHKKKSKHLPNCQREEGNIG